MIRVLNFAFLAITGLVCLGLYRIAEEARIAAADLKSARAAIVQENDSLMVLGAEWARLTQPGRIEALAERHLDLSDRPAPQLASLAQLPSKNPQLVPEGAIRNANAVMPQPAPRPEQGPPVAPETPVAQSSATTYASLRTGT